MVTLKTIKTKFILSSKDGHFFSLVPLQKTWQHFRKWKVQFLNFKFFLQLSFLPIGYLGQKKRKKKRKRKREEAVASVNTPGEGQS
jgi:hypothetical protein